MVSGKEMLVSRSGSLLAATTLIALLVVPMGLHAQETRRIILQPPTGWFGVRISDQAMVDERGNAFFDSYPVITHVDSGSPAAKAGLRGGDILIEFDSKPIQNLYDFTYALRSRKPGDEVIVKVLRGNETISATVLLTKRVE